MINVSSEFRELMAERTDFTCHAAITLADGTEFAWGPEDFALAGNTLTDGAGADGLPLGAAICRTVQLQIVNDDGRLDDVDFFGAVIRLYLDFRLSETTERIALGTFTVTEPETMGSTVTIVAGDAMYKTDRAYETALVFPTTLGAMFRDVCDTCGIPYSTAAFQGSAFQADTAPAGDYTCRQVLGYIAMVAGGNARISRDGRMEIISYDLDREPDHDLTRWVTLKTDTDDILITGIETVSMDEDGVETTILEGAGGYVLQVDNPLIAGKEAQALALMGQGIIGAAFRKFEGEYIAYPLAEFMDTVRLTDRKGNGYTSVITDVEFVFGGRTSLSNSAVSAARNSSKYISPEVRAKIAARELVEQERTARETAIEHLNSLLSGAGGMYSTEEVLPDGSTVYYLHNKPTLAESENVMKLTAEAIGFSTDGGETYPFGFAVTGEMIMGIIRAEGISADWIDSGALTVKDNRGKVIFSVDVGANTFLVDTANFKLDAQGKGTIGGFIIDVDGLYNSVEWNNYESESVITFSISRGDDYQNLPGINFLGSNGVIGSSAKIYVGGTDVASSGMMVGNTPFSYIGMSATGTYAGEDVTSSMKLHYKDGLIVDGDITAENIHGNVDSATTLSSTLGIAKGGTGATTASAARSNLGAFASANIETGAVTISVTANTVSSATVKFSKTFSSVPRVVATSYGSGLSTFSGLSVTDISTTGFTVNILRTNSANTTIYWIAARAE